MLDIDQLNLFIINSLLLGSYLIIFAVLFTESRQDLSISLLAKRYVGHVYCHCR